MASPSSLYQVTTALRSFVFEAPNAEAVREWLERIDQAINTTEYRSR
jgi:hypothetical protein